MSAHQYSARVSRVACEALATASFAKYTPKTGSMFSSNALNPMHPSISCAMPTTISFGLLISVLYDDMVTKLEREHSERLAEASHRGHSSEAAGAPTEAEAAEAEEANQYDIEIAVLRPGDHFGEIALLTGSDLGDMEGEERQGQYSDLWHAKTHQTRRRTATCLAVGASVALQSIDAEPLHGMLKMHDHMRVVLVKEASHRIEEMEHLRNMLGVPASRRRSSSGSSGGSGSGSGSHRSSDVEVEKGARSNQPSPEEVLAHKVSRIQEKCMEQFSESLKTLLAAELSANR